jgi:hypothetical protein
VAPAPNTHPGNDAKQNKVFNPVHGTVKLMPATIEKCCCSSALRFTRQRWRP